ncbi:MAG: cation-translocating P-type ATPase [Blastocatellia bacterium]
MKKRSEVETTVSLGQWHVMAGEEVLARLGSKMGGLGEPEAVVRLDQYGRNSLPAKEPPSLLSIFLNQFKSPLIYILIGAAGVAVGMGDLTDAGFIMVVVLLNAWLGTFQEWKAEQSAASLQKLLKIMARVRRGGTERVIDAEDLVPGDIVLLESGKRVPADLRLLLTNNLSIDESLLTGESRAVDKWPEPLPAPLSTSERINLAYAGSTIMTGRATGVVVATGIGTELGKIAQSVTQAETTKPPLVLRMEVFARQISLAVVGACILLGFVALWRGMPVSDVFFFAVALAVSAIPEGLPVAITVALSIATNRMAKRHVIVRKLTAVEGLGSCTFIASDKTGTLTVNRQTVRVISLPGGERFRVDGEGYAGEGAVITESGEAIPESSLRCLHRLAEASVLCNEASLVFDNGDWKHDGDEVDVALLAFGYKMDHPPDGVRQAIEKLGEIPFESERRYAAVFYRKNGRVKVAIKGALEVLLPRTATMLTPSGSVQINATEIEEEANSMSASGHRFLAIAEGEISVLPTDNKWGEETIPSLTLLGLVGLIDPPRMEAKAAVARCQKAGIEVAMVTGDHPLTALSIARELGIVPQSQSGREVVTGRALEEAGGPQSESFLGLVREARVFARVAPLQKLQIVEALRQMGHFVAVTGDGVNDAPALKRANIGVAMGSGSDVTKDTASLIVTDDNFTSIEAGVEEGRFAYDKIRKVTYLLISTGTAEVLLFLLALVVGVPLPLLPVQILWLNLVTNGIQHLALAFEGGEPGTMQRPPRRPEEGIFNRLMIRQTVVAGGTMGLLAFVNWLLLLNQDWSEAEARNRLLLLFVLMQNFHVFNCRSEYLSAFRVPIQRNYFLIFGVSGALGIHFLAMHLPIMQRILSLSPVEQVEWVIPLAMASLLLVAMEIFKRIEHRVR